MRGPPRDWGCGSKRVPSGLLIGERRQRGLDREAGRSYRVSGRLVAWIGGVGALSPTRVPGRQAALALNGTVGVQASGKGPSSYTAQLPTPTGRSVQHLWTSGNRGTGVSRR